MSVRTVVPHELVRYTRVAGSTSAAAIFATTFPALALVQIAASARTTVTFVQSAMAGALLLSLILVVARVWRRAPLSPRWSVSASCLAAAIGAMAIAVAPGRISLIAGVAAGAWLARTTAPLRGVASTRFPAFRASAQERAQTWSYILLTVYQLAFAAGVWLDAWRWGAAGVALLLAGHGLHLLRWPDFPDPQTEPAPAGDRAWYDVLRIPAALLTILALTLGVVAFQLLFTQLQAHLVDIGLAGGTASVVVASLGAARLVSVPFMRHYGALADQRTPLASLLASRWIGASGLLAAATLLPIAGWGPLAVVAATVAVSCATVALEIGQNSQTTATRGYLSALSLDATTIVTVAVAGSSYLGGQLAALLPWRAIVGGWVLIGVTVWALSVVMRRTPLRDTSWRVYPAPGDALALTLLPPHRGVLLLELSTDPDLPVCDLREGDRIVADGPYDRERARSPRVTEFRVHVHWERHPVRLVRHDGLLRRLRRSPLVATDGLVYGYVRWFGLPGSWRVIELGEGTERWYRLELRSPTLRGAMTLRHKSLHR